MRHNIAEFGSAGLRYVASQSQRGGGGVRRAAGEVGGATLVECVEPSSAHACRQTYWARALRRTYDLVAKPGALDRGP